MHPGRQALGRHTEKDAYAGGHNGQRHQEKDNSLQLASPDISSLDVVLAAVVPQPALATDFAARAYAIRARWADEWPLRATQSGQLQSEVVDLALCTWGWYELLLLRQRLLHRLRCGFLLLRLLWWLPRWLLRLLLWRLLNGRLLMNLPMLQHIH